MMDQLLYSIQRAMLDQARTTAYTIANTRVARRESYLSHLPHRFSSISKAHLRRSDADSGHLFDDVQVDKAIDQAEKTASVSLTEAATKSFIKPKPKLGTPLVERHPRPSTSYDSCPCFRPFLQRPYMKRSRSRHPKGSEASLKKSKGQPFRK